MNWRKIEECFFLCLMRLSALAIFAALAAILITVLLEGLPAMSRAMVFDTPKGGFYLGKAGGVWNAIVGSFYLAAGATALSMCLALPITLYLNVFLPAGSRLAALTRFSFDVLWGVPSIVYGAFGFALMLWMGLKTSLLGGIIAVALVVLPAMCRAMDEVARLVPRELEDASLSLGATQYETAFKVFVRQAMPGVITAALIAFGRAIGDAAAPLFTAGFTDAAPDSLFRPAATLPLAIFFQLGSPVPEVRDRAYAAALILTAMIFIVSAAARAISRKCSKNIIK